jgi:hypothetical protein
MSQSNSIYAFFVGINDYPNPRHRLEGCVRDVTRMKEFLETHFSEKPDHLHIKLLTDQEATRANIIQGFEHFKPAQDGDICLFHYTGHGSRCKVPEAFKEIESDGMLESLVCHDSRLKGGRDLMDKELSYLIWQATEGKDLHFTVILDCCHSGTATRTTYSRPRMAEFGDHAAEISDFLGFEHYHKLGKDQYTPPRGRHVLLAAAKASETAKEVYARGEPCGIFTYCLLETLTKTRGQISYSELINRIHFRIRNKVSDQSPQLEAINQSDKQLFFLSGNDAQSPSFTVGYDKHKGKWIMNAGELHGIQTGSPEEPTLVQLLDSGQQLEVKAVFPHYSELSTPPEVSKMETFKAILLQMPSAPITVAFAPENEPEGEAHLHKLLEAGTKENISLVADPKDADYLIYAIHNHLFLSKPDEAIEETNGSLHPLNKIRSVFRKIEGYSAAAAKDFLYCLDVIARWNRLSTLSKPDSSIRNEEVQLQLFQLTSPEDYENNEPVQEIDWRNPGILQYQEKNGIWYPPAIQLKVKNTGARPLWLSLVYFGDDFSITNRLMAKVELAPGEEAWMLDIVDGSPYKSIPLTVDDAYLQWGITECQDYLKLFICTDEVDTDHFEQEGLELDKPIHLPTRKIGRGSHLKKPDWTTKDITLHSYRPLEATKVKEI